jgi:hypothetical protein
MASFESEKARAEAVVRRRRIVAGRRTRIRNAFFIRGSEGTRYTGLNVYIATERLEGESQDG